MLPTTDLTPRPLFGAQSGPGEVARIVIQGHPEIVAVLDGLQIGYNDDENLVRLLQVCLSCCSAKIQEGLQEDDWGSTPSFAEDIQPAISRLPMAGRALAHQHRRKSLGVVEASGYQAEVAESLSGPFGPFSLDGDEKAAVNFHARLSLSGLQGLGSSDDADRLRAELALILQDTEMEDEGAQHCAISSLPMPRLAEWIERWWRDSPVGIQEGDHPAEKLERTFQHHHRLLKRQVAPRLREVVRKSARRGAQSGATR